MQDTSVAKKGSSYVMITDAMLRTIQFVDTFSRKHGRGPSGNEIGKGTGMSDSNLSGHLRRIVERGWLVRRAVTSANNRPSFRYTVSVAGQEWL